jgi:hypothetical protein
MKKKRYSEEQIVKILLQAGSNFIRFVRGRMS